jgi:predicted nucleic acid-binding protein
LRVLAETDRHGEMFAEIVEESGAVGNLIHDAHIATLCLEHGVSELVTGDRDFRRFSKLRVANPFA